MTWEEIKQAYPEEWVVLIDVEVIDEALKLRSATVAWHGKRRRDVLTRMPPPQGSTWALKYTGADTPANVYFGRFHPR